MLTLQEIRNFSKNLTKDPGQHQPSTPCQASMENVLNGRVAVKAHVKVDKTEVYQIRQEPDEKSMTTNQNPI